MAKTVTTSFSESNIDIINNKSSLTITCYFSANNQTTYSYNKPLYCTCNGETQSATVSLYAGGYVEQSFTFNNIYHDADGKKTVDYSWSCNTLTQGVGVASDSGTYTLQQIPRKATITNAPDFNDEENPILQYSNPAGIVVDSLQACISLDGENDDVPYRDISKIGTSYTFELTEAERNILRNATTTSNTNNVYFIIKTVIGQNTYYSTTENPSLFTIIFGNPQFNNFTYQDINSDVTNITGNNQVLVKGLSTLLVTISNSNKMIPVKGATGKNYIGSIESNTDNQEYSDNEDVNLLLGSINSSGTKRLNVTAYDSRNNAMTVFKDIDIIDYLKPVINASITRLNNFESTTTIQLNGTYSPVNIESIDRNTVESVQYRYRETGGTWGQWNNFTKTASSGIYTCTDVVLNLDNTKAFDVEIQATDTFNQTTTLTYIVDVGQAIFFISSNLKKCYINGSQVLVEDDLNNTELTGTPTAPTANTGTNTTQIATTAFVHNELVTKDVTDELTWSSIVDTKQCLAFGKIRIASFKGTQSNEGNVTLIIAEIPQGHRTSQLRLVGSAIGANNASKNCTMNSSTTASDLNKIQINGTGLNWFAGTMIWIVD